MLAQAYSCMFWDATDAIADDIVPLDVVGREYVMKFLAVTMMLDIVFLLAVLVVEIMFFILRILHPHMRCTANGFRGPFRVAPVYDQMLKLRWCYYAFW
jgi:hypothetical protein